MPSHDFLFREEYQLLLLAMVGKGGEGWILWSLYRVQLLSLSHLHMGCY